MVTCDEAQARTGFPAFDYGDKEASAPDSAEHRHRVKTPKAQSTRFPLYASLVRGSSAGFCNGSVIAASKARPRNDFQLPRLSGFVASVNAIE